MKFIKELNNRESMKKRIADGFMHLIINKETSVMIEELVDCHRGVYIPKVFCDNNNIPHCTNVDDPNYWEDWQWVKDRCEEDIKELCKDIFTELNLDDGLLYIDTLEADGSLCLFLGLEDYYWESKSGITRQWEEGYMDEDEYYLAMAELEKESREVW
jgi:hypothetical protein